MLKLCCRSKEPFCSSTNIQWPLIFFLKISQSSDGSFDQPGCFSMVVIPSADCSAIPGALNYFCCLCFTLEWSSEHARMNCYSIAGLFQNRFLEYPMKLAPTCLSTKWPFLLISSMRVGPLSTSIQCICFKHHSYQRGDKTLQGGKNHVLTSKHEMYNHFTPKEKT